MASDRKAAPEPQQDGATAEEDRARTKKWRPFGDGHRRNTGEPTTPPTPATTTPRATPESAERRPAQRRFALRLAELEKRVAQLDRLEGQINELAAALSETEDRLDALRKERESDQELLAVVTHRFRSADREAGGGP